MPRALLIAILLATAATVGTANAAPVEKHCGNLDPGFSHPDWPQDVRARGVSCHTARRLARKHLHRSRPDGSCDLRKAKCRIGRYTCRRSFFGDSGTRVRCTAPDGDRVRFFYGT
jgi:hypothetical protein